MNEQEKILFELFIQESIELIEQANNTLILLETKYDEELLQEFFRIIHSIKGTSLSMGYDRLSKFIHNLESIIVRIKKDELDFNNEIIGLLYDCISKIKLNINKISCGLLNDLEENDIGDKIYKYLHNDISNDSNKNIDKFYITEYELLVMDDAFKRDENVYVMKITINQNSMMKSMKSFLIISNFNRIGQVLRVHPANYDSINDSDYPKYIKVILITRESAETVKSNIEVASDIDDIKIEAFRGKDNHAKSKDGLFEVRVKKSLQDNDLFRRKERNTIRVEISQLDNFYKKLNELILDKSMLMTIAQGLSEKYNNDNDFKEMISTIKNMDSVTEILEELFIDIRVYTIRNIVSRLEKLINNLSVRSGKKVQLITEGIGIKIDRRILELVVDPLVHIMRNAVDHGIESSEDRIAKGKNELATIELKVVYKKNRVCFEVYDDGKGIDINEVKNSVINKFLATREEIEEMTDDEVLRYIFKPGFSTSKVISDISGRGVGLDVVKSNVEKLNGIINITTKKDNGTKISLIIPLTLITVPSLVFREEDRLFAIPETSVIDTFLFDISEFNKVCINESGNLYYKFNNCRIPIISLLDGLNVSNIEKNSVNLIIVGLREKRICIAVDEIMFNKQLTIKYIEENVFKDISINNIKGIIGTSLLENGKIAYVLDLSSLIKSVD